MQRLIKSRTWRDNKNERKLRMQNPRANFRSAKLIFSYVQYGIISPPKHWTAITIICACPNDSHLRANFSRETLIGDRKNKIELYIFVRR